MPASSLGPATRHYQMASISSRWDYLRRGSVVVVVRKTGIAEDASLMAPACAGRAGYAGRGGPARSPSSETAFRGSYATNAGGCSLRFNTPAILYAPACRIAKLFHDRLSTRYISYTQHRATTTRGPLPSAAHDWTPGRPIIYTFFLLPSFRGSDPRARNK